jgi:hypothetical protein
MGLLDYIGLILSNFDTVKPDYPWEPQKLWPLLTFGPFFRSTLVLQTWDVNVEPKILKAGDR